jgi:A nuclease family of the HNH/ENDO VII superfamily with conserved AHH
MAGPAASSGQYQRHHLIPASTARRAQIGRFLTGLHLSGFHIEDPARNFVILPSDELTAARCGQAMHRGPHPHYCAVVVARVERLRSLHYREQRSAADSAARLGRLQLALRSVLAGDAPRLLTLNRRDPMRLFADYSVLDAAIDAWVGSGPQFAKPPEISA